MNCHESAALLQAFADRQLDGARSAEVASHLAGCAQCSAKYEGLDSLQKLVRSQAEHFEAPSGLRQRVLQVLQEPPVLPAVKRPTRWQALRGLPWAWLNLGVSGVLAASLALVLWLPASAPSGDALAQEVTDSHFRSLMATHLSDVVSTDQHTVKPWFAGKLDFAPPVRDFAPQGYALTGGRLDYLQQRPVAALVYQHKKHVVNLFVWPAAGTVDGRAHAYSKRGYQLLQWTRHGMNYWLVSDMNGTDLAAFQNLLSADEG